MLRHLASCVLFGILAVLAFGSSDSGPKGDSNPSSSTVAVATNEDKRISGDSRFGCSDRDYFEKLVGYAVQNDKQAFSNALAAGILAGTCTMFRDGDEVYVADTAIMSGLIKVRRKGQTEEYWTNLEAVK
jgi:hypothetical protein